MPTQCCKIETNHLQACPGNRSETLNGVGFKFWCGFENWSPVSWRLMVWISWSLRATGGLRLPFCQACPKFTSWVWLYHRALWSNVCESVCPTEKVISQTQRCNEDWISLRQSGSVVSSIYLNTWLSVDFCHWIFSTSITVVKLIIVSGGFVFVVPERVLKLRKKSLTLTPKMN